jgi:hypothetical protein
MFHYNVRAEYAHQNPVQKPHLAYPISARGKPAAGLARAIRFSFGQYPEIPHTAIYVAIEAICVMQRAGQVRGRRA